MPPLQHLPPPPTGADSPPCFPAHLDVLFAGDVTGLEMGLSGAPRFPQRLLQCPPGGPCKRKGGQ